MKITVELTDAEVKGLRKYLQDTGETGSKADISAHVQNIVHGVINAPQEASSHYINQHQQ